MSVLVDEGSSLVDILTGKSKVGFCFGYVDVYVEDGLEARGGR